MTLPTRHPTNRSWIKSVLIKTLMLIALIAAVVHANAQTSDSGEFNDDNSETAPNEDSDYVPGLGMEQPTYGGSGCPQGTVSAVLSPDQRTLSVLFDAYIAEAGGNTGRRQSALGCQINIPFHVPSGYRVQVVRMQYRGYTATPQGARTQVSAGFRYLEVNGVPTGAPRVLRTKNFVGPKQKNFRIGSRLQGKHWSPCGKPFVLAAESQLDVATNSAAEPVLSTIDSLDAAQMPVEYSLRWRKCKDRDERPDRPDRPNRPGRTAGSIAIDGE